MARVKTVEIVEDLASEFRHALIDAVREVIPDAEFDEHDLFRAFKSSIRKKCSTWTRVKGSHVEL